MRITEPQIDERMVGSRGIILIAVPIIVLGIIAIIFPFFSTIAATLYFGWVFIFAGIAQIIYAFSLRDLGQFAWKFILGFLYLLTGIFVLKNPFEGVLAFTLALGITMLVQGIIQVSVALRMRRILPNWGWMLASGLVGIVFGIVVWSSSPSTATWLIGTLIGVNLLSDGVWMLTLHSGQQYTLR
ncbi:MAG: HdeD family acid-resistance protein [Thermosynechococcaceae cyanobacterium]